jgi:hypothetical protein
MTGINRETVCEILVKDLKKKKERKSVCSFCSSYVNAGCTASSVEFHQMTDEDGNVLKRIIMGNVSWCFMCDPETRLQSEA